MHDIWNPWHGCRKCSEGCQNCYMYYLDSLRDKDGSEIYRTKAGFKYPLSKYRDGTFKVKSGEMIRVCMTSDFFLEEADSWRDEAWQIIRQRSDVKFFLLTKRPERVADHLPWNWGDGWENVMFNVTCENQKRADERIPILLDLPFKHKGIMIDKRKIHANTSTEISKIVWDMDLEVCIGLDCIWRACFRKKKNDLYVIKDNDLLQRLCSYTGPQIIVSHTMGCIATVLVEYPKVRKWIYKCIRLGRMNERAYRELLKIVSKVESVGE